MDYGAKHSIYLHCVLGATGIFTTCPILDTQEVLNAPLSPSSWDHGQHKCEMRMSHVCPILATFRVAILAGRAG